MASITIQDEFLRTSGHAGRKRPELESKFVAPRTETEAILCATWSEVLQIEAVGVRDDFFALGGDSLSLFRLISRVEPAFGIELRAVGIADALTVEAIARVLDARLAAR